MAEPPEAAERWGWTFDFKAELYFGSSRIHFGSLNLGFAVVKISVLLKE